MNAIIKREFGNYTLGQVLNVKTKSNYTPREGITKKVLHNGEEIPYKNVLLIKRNHFGSRLIGKRV